MSIRNSTHVVFMHLCKGYIDVKRFLALQAVVLNISYNAYNLDWPWSSVVIVYTYVAASRISLGPQSPCHRFVYQCDWNCVSAIAIVERSAVQEWDFHCPKVAGRGRPKLRGVFVRRRISTAGDAELYYVSCATHRQN